MKGGGFVTFCFAAATFLGAFLLFLVQPLIAKYILPWFGGGAAVWTTCLVFFQLILLAGYLYAHLGVSRLRIGAQALVHAGLLLVAVAIALPAITPSERWKPLVQEDPIGKILLLLAVTVGLPCVALSATSPLLHAWYARLRPGAAVYRLYALSNAGSLLALLAYPLVVEPFFSRRVQVTAWSIGLTVFAAVCAACAMFAAQARPVETSPERADVADADRVAGGLPFAPLLWLALPACASALLLATTNAITQDFAPVPLLWIVPLALYLLTFIVAFDRPRWYRRDVFGWLFAVAVAGAAWVMAKNEGALPVVLGVGGVIPAMFLGCMVLHGELVRLQPPPARLTTYYLMIAAGGALGGLLVAVGAPLLLRSYAELPMAIWACAALALATPHLVARKLPTSPAGMLGILGVVALAPLMWGASRSASIPQATHVSSDRDFYGVLSVWKVDSPEGKGIVLRHGRITHGHQFEFARRRATPTTYYHAASGVGLVLGQHSPLPKPRRVGAIGLGAGTIAAFAEAGDFYRFYEISPIDVRLARESFTYLQDANARGATCDTVLGDGRLSLEREPADLKFDAIVLDAFSGDAIPVHLLTSEAFDLYAARLAPSGIVCVHASNNYIDLRPVIAAAAKRLAWSAVMLYTDKDDSKARFAAMWVLLSPDPQRIAALRKFGATRPPTELTDFAPWTDEHAGVLRLLASEKVGPVQP